MRNTATLVTCFFLLSFAVTGYAQCPDMSASGVCAKPKAGIGIRMPEMIVKAMPMCLIAKESNYRGGLEIKLTDNLALQQDLGIYNFAPQWYPTLGLSKRKGFIARTELRIYMLPAAPMSGFYFAFQGVYKKVNNTSFREDISTCNDPQKKLVYVYYDKKNIGGYMKMGCQLVRGKWAMDGSIGMGWRELQRWHKNLDALPESSEGDYEDYEFRSGLSMQVGMSIGYKLK
jgi:hypothetical protein